ncbi:MAG: transposase [Treponema sp.]|nr:transposase [Treponema sp.]
MLSHHRLIFLPPYSPNLNLIERFWKLVKAKALNAAYHRTFEDCKRTIDDCVSGMITSTSREQKQKSSCLYISMRLPRPVKERSSISR